MADDRDAHWALIRSLPCMVCGKPGPSTLHHPHGGSMRYRGVHKAGGKKTSDFLVIPLCVDHHTGYAGIDSGMGVLTWEQRFGEQAGMIDRLGGWLGLDLWALASQNPPQTRQSRRKDLGLPNPYRRAKARQRGSQARTSPTARPSKILPHSGKP